ncbi:hypothetical protein RIF29_29119 [Crotalaria pallida]|uniref:Uncharacterized protein n=1 Tax=Crotalaria pallida TaxID=3830 RepID=A0AAN9HX65_CROPI
MATPARFLAFSKGPRWISKAMLGDKDQEILFRAQQGYSFIKAISQNKVIFKQLFILQGIVVTNQEEKGSSRVNSGSMTSKPMDPRHFQPAGVNSQPPSSNGNIEILML